MTKLTIRYQGSSDFYYAYHTLCTQLVNMYNTININNNSNYVIIALRRNGLFYRELLYAEI